MAIMVILMFNSCDTQEKFTDSKLPHKTGILFENQGQIKVVTTKWTLVMYLDLNKYGQTNKEIVDYDSYTEEMCAKIAAGNPNYKLCKLVQEAFNKQLKSIAERETTLLESVARRSKREAPLEWVGNIAHVLFGICDAKCIAKHDQ